MNSKLLVAGIVLVLVVGAGAFFFLNMNKSQTGVTNNASPTESTSSEEKTTKETQIEEVEISLTNQGFSPASITIDKETKVVWTNNSGVMANVSSAPLPIHTNSPPLNLGNFGDGDTRELIFSDSGTYGYHNHLNATQRGTIIV